MASRRRLLAAVFLATVTTACRPALPGYVPALPTSVGGVGATGSAVQDFQIEVRPYLAAPGRKTQATVSRYTAATIARLDIVPYREVATSLFRPISASTGEAVALSDPDVLKATLAAPLDFEVPVKIGRLKANKRYWIFSHAYDAQGNLISTLGAESYVEIAVGTDDRPPAQVRLPVRLQDTFFSGTVKVSVDAAANAVFDRVALGLAIVGSGIEIPLPSAAATILVSGLPRMARLDRLQANSAYVLRGEGRIGSDSGPVVARGTVRIQVRDDDVLSDLVLTVPAGAIGTAVGNVSTLAGGQGGLADGTGAAAKLSGPSGIAVDPYGNAYVADTDNHAIRKISTAGVVSTIAGSGDPGFQDGTAGVARFNQPMGLALDRMGNLYVADSGNNCVRRVTARGAVTRYAGSGQAGWADGEAASARFSAPAGVAVDGTGNVFVSEAAGHRIRKISTTGQVSTVAGSGQASFADGSAESAAFDTPRGIALDLAGNLYVADSGNRRVRKVTPDRIVTTLAGTGARGSTDGSADAATFDMPWGIASDTAGRIVIADEGSHRLRLLSPAGAVTTLAGGDAGLVDAPGRDARFWQPRGVAVNGSDDFVVADRGNHRIRKVGQAPHPLQAAPAPTAIPEQPSAGGAGISFGHVANPQRVRRVVIANLGSATLNPGESATLEAIGIANGGQLVPTPWVWSLAYAATDPYRGYVWSVGDARARWVTQAGNARAGAATVYARADSGATGSITLTVANVTPARTSVSVDPVASGPADGDAVRVRSGQAATFRFVFRDANGTIEAPTQGSRYSYGVSDATVGWSTPGGTISGVGGTYTWSQAFTFTGEGAATLTFKVRDGESNTLEQKWTVTAQ